MVDQGPVETQDVSVSGLADATTASSGITVDTSSGMDLPPGVGNRPVYRLSGPILWTPGPWMSPSCRFQERDTGSWKDGLAIIRWTYLWIWGLL